MFFNVNQPASERSLAQLYTNNPNLSPEQVQSNIFLGSARNATWLQEQGRNLGIGDPVQHYTALLAQQQMQSTPSGFQMEAMRQAGQYPSNSLPGQLAAREEVANGLMSLDAKRSQELASLQMAGIDRNYPLPVPGTASRMSPLMQEDATAQGMQDPRAYIMNKRLQMMGASGVVQPFNQTSSSVDPSVLYRTPGFRRAMQSQPNQAAGAMLALTGNSLPAVQADYNNNQGQLVKEGTQYFNKGFQDRTFKLEGDKIRQRKYAVNPVSGTYGPTEEYGDLEEYPVGLWAEPEVQRNVIGDAEDRLRKLAALGPPGAQRHARGAIPADAPPFFKTPAFARLQKSDPAKAHAFWLEWLQSNRPSETPRANMVQPGGWGLPEGAQAPMF